MLNNVSVNSSVLGVFVCGLLLFRKSVPIVVLLINKIKKKKNTNETKTKVEMVCFAYYHLLAQQIFMLQKVDG